MRKKVRRLTRLRIDEVSLVEQPANLTPFTFVKSVDNTDEFVEVDPEDLEKLLDVEIEISPDELLQYIYDDTMME